MKSDEDRLEQERRKIEVAQARGPLSTLALYARLSGPGWLQSAITLGGGSLASALFLGILGGTNMLWLQLVAIAMGVIMLSAISYVTLSTGERPFRSIRDHINPVLAWAWVIATIMANMIWCMPQFSLACDALQKNLLAPDRFPDDDQSKMVVSIIILAAASVAVFFNGRPGFAARVFDLFLKALIAMIVISFVAVVGLLTAKGQLDWAAIMKGFIPDFSQWSKPTGTLRSLLAELPKDASEFWSGRIVGSQSSVMISAAATAVGINMTFLMPYSLLKRGWSQAHRGLSRFDLATGMAIPYVLVTSCIVIAAAAQFHGKADEQFLSGDPAVMQKSPLYAGAGELLKQRVSPDLDFDTLSKDEKKTLTDAEVQLAAALPESEKRIVSSLVKRNAFDLSSALEPLLGKERARLAFGLGVLGMAFSTIIILMVINGYAFCELAGSPLGGIPYFIGCLVAGIVGALWWVVWQGESKVYLVIVASTFGMMLLPIAYITFFMMMNSRRVLGDALPTGGRRVVWNLLMGISVICTIAAAWKAIADKAGDPDTGRWVIWGAIGLILVVLPGFHFRKDEERKATVPLDPPSA